MPSNAKPFTAAASVAFALVAIGHLLRVVFELDFVVGDYAVSPAASVVATIIAATLALMVRRESRS